MSSARRFEVIRETLREKIAQGALPPGQVLLEGPLAELFQVSRTPVKQALRELAAEGLVRRFDGRGFVVPGATGATARLSRRLPDDLRAEPAASEGAAWRRLHDEVEREIAARIAFGPLRIVEAAMAEHFGVSRTVVRDVLSRLHGVGLLEKDRQGRWIAAPLTAQRLAELYELRWLLEPAALVDAAPRLGIGELRRMVARLDDALSRYPEVTGAELDALEHDLHVDCLDRCRNRQVVRVLKHTQLLLISSRHLFDRFLRLPETEPFLGEHRQVLRFLIEGETATAAAALVDHLKASLGKYARRLEDVSAMAEPPRPAYLVRL